MIQIKRDCPPQNSTMDKQKNEELNCIKECIKKEEPLKIKPLWKTNEVKQFLYQSQNKKCCYCERLRDQAEMDVEHFRPKARIKENPEHPGYWWLAYNWDNLLIACKKCNNKKGSQFPLKNENKRAREYEEIEKENPLLINPLIENPEDLIEYYIPPEDSAKPIIMIEAIGKCERAEKTIKDLTGINSKELLLERAKCFKDYCLLIKCLCLLSSNPHIKKEIHKRIKSYKKSSSQFAGFARFYFNRVLKLNA